MTQNISAVNCLDAKMYRRQHLTVLKSRLQIFLRQNVSAPKG